MVIQDDRTPAQKKTHVWAIVGSDRFMSGWGGARGGGKAGWLGLFPTTNQSTKF